MMLEQPVRKDQAPSLPEVKMSKHKELDDDFNFDDFEGGELDDIDTAPLSNKRKQNPKPGNNKNQSVDDELDGLWGGKPQANNNKNNNYGQNSSITAYQLNSGSLSSIDDLLTQAFTLLFRDKLSGFPLLMQRIFNGTVQRNMDTAKFLNELVDADTLKLRNIVFHSARLAMHLAIDKFIMGEVEMPPHDELKVSVT